MSWRLRLACRVCLAVGIDDPEEWLEQVKPRTLALWEAFFRVEPWGFEFERTATTNVMLSRLASMIAATSIGKGIKTQDVKDFMPNTWVSSEPPKPKRANLKAVQQKIASIFPTADRR